MSDILTILMPVLRFAFYPAMLLAVGGIIFSMMMVRHLGPEMRAYTGRVTRRAAIAGVCLTALQVPAAAGNLAGDMAGMLDPVLIGIMLEAPTGAAAVMGLAGFLLILFGEWFVQDPVHPARITGPGIVILSLALSGHATTGSLLTAGLLVVHLAGLGFWMGGLLPLRAMSRAPGQYGGLPALAGTAEAFGKLAGWSVALLVAAGGVYAAQLLGSFTALLTTAYGNLLLMKIGLVGGLLGLAAYNRWRLTPRLQAGNHDAARRLGHLISLELLAVLAILVVTGLMTTSVGLPV